MSDSPVSEAPWKERLQHKLDGFATFTIDIIYDRRSGMAARLWGGVLYLMSLLYRILVALRAFLYKHGILRAQHLGCLVVVVGNLTVGGTGKTPVVERLARTLQAKGRKVAILSRGYKSKKEPFFLKWWRWMLHKPPKPPKVISDGTTVFFNSEEAGDEPYMLARNLPGVVVVTDKDRVKAGQFAIRNFGVDTLILDDGFQYFQLKDHLQLLLIDKSNPFGNGHLLPRGILREPLAQMKRASYIFLTKSEDPPSESLVAELQRFRDERKWMQCAHRPKYFRAVNGDTRKDLTFLKGQRVGALSGIAAPESFEAFLHELGAEAVVPYRFLDHHRFTPAELREVFASARERELDLLVTTEKDAVRIETGMETDFPFYYLRVEIHMSAGSENFEAAVKRICFPRQVDDAQRWVSGRTQPPFPVRELQD